MDLSREAIAARDLRQAMIDYEADEVQLAIESETNLLEELERAVNRLAELETLIAALQAVMKQQAARLARFKGAHERIRTQIQDAFESVPLASPLELPSATISLGQGQPAIHIPCLLYVPEKFVRFPAPEPNREAIRAEWRQGREVAGVLKGNTKPVLTIKRT